MKPLLSITIPTVEKRKKCFEEFYEEIVHQSNPYGNQIEIISLCDNKEMTIGEKRNKLNEMANGKYVVQWDDDDWISKDAIQLIMEAIDLNVDCITHKSPIDKTEIWTAEFFYYSIKHMWEFKKNIWYIAPDQKCPIKKEIVDKVKFKHIRNQEDKEYGISIKNLLKTEYFIPTPIYFHLNRSNESMNDFNGRYGIKPNKLI